MGRCGRHRCIPPRVGRCLRRRYDVRVDGLLVAVGAAGATLDADENNPAFDDVDLKGADLTGQGLVGLDLSQRDLQGANLDGASAVNASFVSSHLAEASLRDAASLARISQERA